MSYTPKTDWQTNDIVMPEDMNRVEQGVEDNADDILTLQTRVTDVESCIETPDLNTATLTELTQIQSVTDSYGSIAEFEVGGATLYQAVTNGDFANGTTGLTGGHAVVSVNNTVFSVTGNGNNLRASAIVNVPFVSGQKYFIKSRQRVTNEVTTYLKLESDTGAKVTVTSPIQNQWYNLYAIFTATSDTYVRVSHYYVDATTANGKVMEVEGDWTKGGGVFAIPITGTPYENYTADQMNALVNEYWEGLKSAQKVNIYSKNNLDEILSTVTINCTDSTKFDRSKLPNLVQNTVGFKDGKWWADKKVARYVLQASDIVTYSTSFELVDIVITKVPFAGDAKLPVSTEPIKGMQTIAGWKETVYSSITTPEAVGKFNTHITGNIRFVVAKGAYANLATAQAALAGTVIYYELATPIEIPEEDFSEYGIEVSGTLTSDNDFTEFYADSYDIFSPISIDYAVNLAKSVENLKESVQGLRENIDDTITKASTAVVGNMAQFTDTGDIEDSGLKFSIYNGGLRVTYDDGL